MKSLSVLTIIASFLLASCSSDHKEKRSRPAGSQISYAGTKSLAPTTVEVTKPQIDKVTAQWSPENKKMLSDLINKYGEPQEANEREVTWFNNGQWNKTILTTESGSAILRQTANMTVPPESLGDLSTYSKNISVDQAQDQVTVANRKEELNFLALNLAKEVIEGRMSPFEARRQYSTLSSSLNRSQFLEGLSFGLPGSKQGTKQSQEE